MQDGGASPVFFIQFNVSVGSTLPVGSIILCKAELVPGSNEVGPGETQHRLTSLGAATSATVLRDPTAECALEIPFSWTGDTGRSEIAMHYEIDAIARPGTLPVVLTRGVRSGLRVAEPPAGSFVRLGFNGVR